MISPEILRRFSFFNELDNNHITKLALISETKDFQSGSLVFDEGNFAETFFLLAQGSIDLFLRIECENPSESKEVLVGEVNPLEPLGISALVDPFVYTSSARTSSACTLVMIPSDQLKKLCQDDIYINCCLMHQIAKSAISRLSATRIQLAAAWA